MSDQLKALYDLQQVDSKIHKNKQLLDALDDGATLKKQLAAADVQKTRYESDVRKTETALKDAELELKSIEEKKSTFEKKLYGGGISNPKELSGIEKEIESLGRKRTELDERVLELYDQLEKQKTTLSEFSDRIESANRRLKMITDKYEEESKKLSSEIATFEAEREGLTKGIDKPLLSRYDTIRTRANGLAIVRIVDGKCGGCNIKMTAFALREARESDHPTYCESCGRIILLGNE